MSKWLLTLLLSFGLLSIRGTSQENGHSYKSPQSDPEAADCKKVPVGESLHLPHFPIDGFKAPFILGDGEQILSLSDSKNLLITNPINHSQKKISFGAEIEFAALSPDSKSAYVMARNGEARVINLKGQDFAARSHNGKTIESLEELPDFGQLLQLFQNDPEALFRDPRLKFYYTRLDASEAPFYLPYFSHDGKFLLTLSDNAEAGLLNLTTGTATDILPSGRWSDLRFIPGSSSQVLMISAFDKRLVIFDIHSKKTLASLKPPGAVADPVFSRDGKQVVASGKNKLVLFDLNDLKLQEFKIPDDYAGLVGSFPSGHVLYQAVDPTREVQAKTLNIKTGALETLPYKKVYKIFPGESEDEIIIHGEELSGGTKYFLYNLDSKKSRALDPYYLGGTTPSPWIFYKNGSNFVALNSDTAKHYKLPLSLVPASISYVGALSSQKALFRIIGDKDGVLDLESNPSAPHFHYSEARTTLGAYLDNKNHLHVLEQRENKVSDRNASLKTNESFNEYYYENIDYLPDSSSFLLKASESSYVLKSPRRICGREAKVKWPDPKALSMAPTSFRNRKTQLCSQSFDANEWDALYPPIPLRQNLSQDEVEFYLTKFSKPGGFVPARDALMFKSLLDDFIIDMKLGALPSVEISNRLSLIVGALGNVLLSSSELYKWYLEDPFASGALHRAETKPCHSESESKSISEAKLKFLEHSAKVVSGGSDANKIIHLLPFGSHYASLARDYKESMINKLAQGLADGAKKTSELKGVSTSKLYKFSKPFVENYVFRMTVTPITDFTISKNHDNLEPLLLGTQSMKWKNQTSQDSGFGFHSLALPRIALNKSMPVSSNPAPELNRTEWQHDGLEFSATNKLEILDPATVIVPATETPPYDKLWSDATLSGLFVTGSTGGKLDANATMDELLSYFSNEDFEFSEPSPISDLNTFLKEKISSGEIDYFLKEAHSDGDEKNLFRVYKSATYIVGTRTRSDQKKEKVYLVYPPKDDNETLLVSNSDFGSWVRARGAAGSSPLVYINGSCWSDTKAVREIQAAKSSSLINIPSITDANFFEDHPASNSKYWIIDGLRNERTWAEIKESFSQLPEYAAQSGDVFALPHEESYDKRVRSLLEIPVEIETKVFNAKGLPYNIDDIRN